MSWKKQNLLTLYRYKKSFDMTSLVKTISNHLTCSRVKCSTTQFSEEVPVAEALLSLATSAIGPPSLYEELASCSWGPRPSYEEATRWVTKSTTINASGGVCPVVDISSEDEAKEVTDGPSNAPDHNSTPAPVLPPVPEGIPVYDNSPGWIPRARKVLNLFVEKEGKKVGEVY